MQPARLPDLPEGRRLLLRASQGDPEMALEAWKSWLNLGIPRDRFSQRIFPGIYQKLRQLEPPRLQELEQAYSAALLGSQRQFHALRPILLEWQKAGIQPMLLKGSALQLQGNFVRPMEDTDVLVRPEMAREAARIARRLGWKAEFPYFPWPGCHHAVDFRGPNGGNLDLHWSLLHYCRWPGADQGAWQRSQPFWLAGIPIRLPAACDGFLQVCAHGWLTKDPHLWVIDALEILRTQAEFLDWEAFLSEVGLRALPSALIENLRFLEQQTGQSLAEPLERLQGLLGHGLDAWFFEAQFGSNKALAWLGDFGRHWKHNGPRQIPGFCWLLADRVHEVLCLQSGRPR